MKYILALLLFTTLAHAEDCKKIETFIQETTARLPDLVTTKMDAQKAAQLTAVVNKATHSNYKGDVVVIGMYTFAGVKKIGYAIFDNDCMMYGEAIPASDWKLVEPLIFGKES